VSVWLSKDEVCALTGWSERHLRRLAVAGSVSIRDSATLVYRGHAAKEFELASLPAEAQAKYLGGRSARTAAAKTSPLQVKSPLALTPLFDDETESPVEATQITRPVRVALPAAAQAEATKRLAILKPLIEYLEAPIAGRDRFHQLRLASGTPVTNSDALVNYLAEQHGISARTLWRWKKRFDADGTFALARKPQAGKGQSTWAAANRALADLAALVYMGNSEQPAQSMTVAYEEVCARAQVLGIPAPSYKTIRAFLSNPNEVSPSMRTLGRDGRKKYDATFAPYITRGYTEPAYSIIVSDHMIHDALVQNDLFGARDLAHMRLRMTTLLDYRSRYVVGVSWCEEGSSHSIKRALLRAFTRYGLPEAFYCDNGKDYQKVARGAQRYEMEAMQREAALRIQEVTALQDSVMRRLNIPTTFCTPFHPQAKHIERYHRTVHERFDCAFVTYTAGAPHLRPDAATAALARHGKLLQMGQTRQRSQLPLASEFIQMCEAWIEQWYHRRPQDGHGMEGRSPAQVFAEEMTPNVRPCPEPALLAMLLCERVTRKVMNCEIRLDGAEFVPDLSDAWANLQMHERSGREVVVAYDPLDPMYAAVLDEDLNFLCRVQRKDLVRFSHDDDTRTQVQSFISNRNGLRKAVRESTQALNRRVRGAGYMTREEQLREMAQLPRAVGEQIVQRPTSPATDTDLKATHSEDNAARYLENLRRSHGSV
jgi:hypothetical protein